MTWHGVEKEEKPCPVFFAKKRGKVVHFESELFIQNAAQQPKGKK